MVQDFIFAELKFVDSYTTKLSDLYHKPNLGELAVNGSLRIVQLRRFGELVINSNSPIFSVVKVWRVSHNFMYTEHVYKFTAMFLVFVII